MPIPIPPIPIGAKYVAAVQGAVWKFVSCAHCQQRYAYLLELEATGEDHDPLFLDAEGSAERARVKAEENLLKKGRNVVLPVPCPSCGFYQDDMARMLKEEVSINPLQIAGVVIVLLSLVPLAFGIPYIWILSIVLAVVGSALLVDGYVIAFRFDPNAGDPEPRKALGRRHALWDEQLEELLATGVIVAGDGQQQQPAQANANALKITVFTGGEISVDGQAASLDQVSAKLAELKKAHGAVLYHRENPQGEPHPNAMKVMELVAENQLPICLCAKADFSDSVDEQGVSHPGK